MAQRAEAGAGLLAVLAGVEGPGRHLGGEGGLSDPGPHHRVTTDHLGAPGPGCWHGGGRLGGGARGGGRRGGGGQAGVQTHAPHTRAPGARGNFPATWIMVWLISVNRVFMHKIWVTESMIIILDTGHVCQAVPGCNRWCWSLSCWAQPYKKMHLDLSWGKHKYTISPHNTHTQYSIARVKCFPDRPTESLQLLGK